MAIFRDESHENLMSQEELIDNQSFQWTIDDPAFLHIVHRKWPATLLYWIQPIHGTQESTDRQCSDGCAWKHQAQVQLDQGGEGVKNINRQLRILMDMEAEEKVLPINSKDDKRKIFYTIANNHVRFYQAYIFLHKDEMWRLGPDTFYRMYIAPGIRTFISYRAEAIARSYFIRKARQDKPWMCLI